MMGSKIILDAYGYHILDNGDVRTYDKREPRYGNDHPTYEHLGNVKSNPDLLKKIIEIAKDVGKDELRRDLKNLLQIK